MTTQDMIARFYKYEDLFRERNGHLVKSLHKNAYSVANIETASDYPRDLNELGLFKDSSRQHESDFGNFSFPSLDGLKKNISKSKQSNLDSFCADLRNDKLPAEHVLTIKVRAPMKVIEVKSAYFTLPTTKKNELEVEFPAEQKSPSRQTPSVRARRYTMYPLPIVKRGLSVDQDVYIPVTFVRCHSFRRELVMTEIQAIKEEYFTLESLGVTLLYLLYELRFHTKSPPVEALHVSYSLYSMQRLRTYSNFLEFAPVLVDICSVDNFFRKEQRKSMESGTEWKEGICLEGTQHAFRIELYAGDENVKLHGFTMKNHELNAQHFVSESYCEAGTELQLNYWRPGYKEACMRTLKLHAHPLVVAAMLTKLMDFESVFVEYHQAVRRIDGKIVASELVNNFLNSQFAKFERYRDCSTKVSNINTQDFDTIFRSTFMDLDLDLDLDPDAKSEDK